ncbi:hypothetical protein DPMN_062500 [Dreissena polymorpha]|uniref:14-3-3 domain-containing protein n=1 Tax=Dreissena polymorpha TaxID=45954 RepID=A0A9D4C9G5_DREPO|nr:hypothetical protein DPMN_062438 [Dreissena polymorpha]KAH3719650.1 hypothetical protein DPMN_062500 [Dreissena polymorpha]
MSSDDRRTLLERAQLAEEAGRWEDMVSHIRAIVVTGQELTVEERNLFANAYKNHVGNKRAAWRVISTIEQKIDSSSRRRDLSREYRMKIEDELKACCNEVLHLIDTYLIHTIDVENKIFYHKMQGDYFRYLSEFSRYTTSDRVFDSAKVAYAHALELAREHLSASHPLRLGLVLNFSVFHFEILESHEIACDMAKDAVSAGVNELNIQPEEARKDSALLLELLKDNIKIWSAEVDSEQQLHRATVRSNFR